MSNNPNSMCNGMPVTRQLQWKHTKKIKGMHCAAAPDKKINACFGLHKRKLNPAFEKLNIPAKTVAIKIAKAINKLPANIFC